MYVHICRAHLPWNKFDAAFEKTNHARYSVELINTGYLKDVA